VEKEDMILEDRKVAEEAEAVLRIPSSASGILASCEDVSSDKGAVLRNPKWATVRHPAIGD